MKIIHEKIATIDWTAISQNMHNNGYALISKLLMKEQCDELKSLYDKPDLYRKIVTMERYRFGLGEYKYFNYPLPSLIQTIREEIYPHLAPIANAWMRALGMDEKFPDTLPDLLARCQSNNQLKPTPLILKYGPGGTTRCIRICMAMCTSQYKPYCFFRNPKRITQEANLYLRSKPHARNQRQ